MTSSERVKTALIEDLLYSSEGVDLDFKRDQYRFEGATDLDKAELLKDILAFANSFRRNLAYILIGVQEVAGGRATVVGITDHLRDADLQQFVNTKTNRDVVFSYHAVEVEGRQVGVIRIEEQQRPIFLKKDFGFDALRKCPKLIANKVYFRVGSSTKEASPEDIARMGAHTGRAPAYDVELQFANIQRKITLGKALHTEHSLLQFEGKIPDYTSRAPLHTPHGIVVPRDFINDDNRDFWREAYNYVLHKNLLAEIGFCIENRGDTTIDDVTVELTFAAAHCILAMTSQDVPEKPEPHSSIYSRLHMPTLHDPSSTVHVEKRGDELAITLQFGKLQAGQRRFLSDALYLAAPAERHFVVDAIIRADQFPSPLVSRLDFHLKGEVRNIEWTELKEIIAETVLRARK